MVFSNNLLMGAAAAASGVAAAYVPKGAIWLDGTADYLNWTPGSAPTSKRIVTFSFWFKRSAIGAEQFFIQQDWSSSGNNAINVKIQSNDKLYVLLETSAGSNVVFRISTQVFRDPTAWANLVINIDTNQTDDTSCTVYLNGRVITDWDTKVNPGSAQDNDIWNTSKAMGLFWDQGSGANWWNGYQAETIALDGYSAPPSDFGTEDSNGVWIPKDPTDTVTTNKGTNGFWLDFANSSDLGNDVSGNDNDFSLEGNLDSNNWTYDRPADSGTTIGNLATYNPIDILGNTLATTNVWSLGNTKVTHQCGAN